MAAYSVVCPECRTSLKTPKPIAPGTPLECPNCQVMFAAPKPRPAARPSARPAGRPAGKPSAFTPPLHRDQIGDDVVEDVEVVDDVEVIDDVEVVDDDAPPRRKKAPPPARRKPVNRGIEVVDDDEDDDFDDRPKRKFKAKRKSGSNKGLVIGLVVLGVLVVLGGAGGLAYWLLAGGAGEEPLAYLPADTQIVAGVNFGSLIKEVPAIGQQVDQFAHQMVAQADSGGGAGWAAGIEPKEMFDQVFIGARAESGGTPIFTFVTLSSKPFDRAKLVSSDKPGQSKKSGYGQTYFESSPAGFTIRTFYANKRNTVVTSVPETQAVPIFKSDGKTIKLPGPLSALVAKVRSNHAWAVANLDDALKQQLSAAASRSVPGMPAGGGAAGAAEAFNGVTGLAAWANVQSGRLDLHIGLECSDAASAQAKVAKVQADVTKLTTVLSVLAAAKSEARPVADDVKKSLKVAANGTTAEISLQVGVGDLEALVASLAGAGQQPPRPANQPDQNNQRRGPQRRGVNRGGS